MTRRPYIYWYPLLLMLAWTGAWLLNRDLTSVWNWGVGADTAYWISMKFVVWLIPVFLLILMVERQDLVDFLALRRFWKGTTWGLLAGLLVATADFLAQAHASGKYLALPEPGAAFLNGVIMAPITEEITFRAFFLERLRLNGISFWKCNLATSIFFIAMHLVGWSFQGRIGSFAHLMEQLAPLLFLSLLFGWLKQKTGSLYASIAAHIINNLYSLALKGA